MKKYLQRLTVISAAMFAGEIPHSATHTPPSPDGTSFISNEEQTDYLRRTYGYALWRHWEHVPQKLRDNFDKGENNPIWKHHIFLRELEKTFQKTKDTQERQVAFNELAADYFPSDEIQSIQHYFSVIENYVARTEQKTQSENTLMDRYLASVQTTQPAIAIEKTPQLSSANDLNNFSKLYGKTSTGKGVMWGEYGVAHSLNGDQIIATDYLMDCVAVVLTSENPDDPNDKHAVLAHVDATTEPTQAIAKLLGEIPENHTIKAQILGSDRNENAYMNVTLAEALVNSKRIASIAVNTEGATTVAVHAQSGTVLSSNDPEKGEGNAYSITTLPVRVVFSEQPPFQNFRSLNYQQLLGMRLDQKFKPVSPIIRTAHPTLPNDEHPAIDAIVDDAKKDNRITAEEFRKMAEAVKQNMYTPDGVCISVGEWKLAANIGTQDNVTLSYVSDRTKYDPVPNDLMCKQPAP